MKWFEKCPRCAHVAEPRRQCVCGFSTYEQAAYAPGSREVHPIPQAAESGYSTVRGAIPQDLPTYSARLKDALYPSAYRRSARTDAKPFTLLLTHMNWLALGRYALAVLPWEAVEEKSEVLHVARSGVCNYMFTIPYLWQVGLYLVVSGPYDEWSSIAPQVCADQTGLHAVIVQAIHFIDLQTGKTHLSRSQWGPIRFGGTVSVTDRVNSNLVGPT